MLSLDANWFSRLEDTRWISIVAICLQSALRVVEDLIDKMLTVVIKGGFVSVSVVSLFNLYVINLFN